MTKRQVFFKLLRVVWAWWGDATDPDSDGGETITKPEKIDLAHRLIDAIGIVRDDLFEDEAGPEEALPE